MKNICIIGGCGHVGIPLGLALASKNFNVTLIDVNTNAVDKINSKKTPFKEEGAEIYYFGTTNDSLKNINT